jgi:hypothetical protein
MDSNNCQGNEKIEAIKQQIDSGELTFDDMCRCLSKSINVELSKPFDEIDNEFVSSCQKLLDSLLNTAPYQSRQPQYEKELIQQLKITKSYSIRRRVYSAIAVAVALIIFAVIGQEALTHKWLEGVPSEDNQQYVVSGYEVDPQLVNTGIASTESHEHKETTTQNLDEAIDVLGFSPLMPTYYPDGWDSYVYYANKHTLYQWFYEALVSSEHEIIIRYEVKKFSDIANATANFEQSVLGSTIKCNGWNVYMTTNIRDSIAVWIDGTTCYSLSGPLSFDEMTTIINSIKKGE